MSEVEKARRSYAAIGNLQIEGFRMPDGSYRMSQSQAAECIGLGAQNASRFFQSKAFKALRGNESTDHAFDQIEVESSQQTTGGTRINAVPLDVVMLFWIYQCSRGNKQAITLLAALATETLERRFDKAFGVPRTEEEYNQVLAERMQLEQDIESLAEAYAEPDLLREENERLKEQLRQAGIEPFQIEPQDSE